MKFITELSNDDIIAVLREHVGKNPAFRVKAVRLDITAPYHCADQRENTLGSVRAIVECEPVAHVKGPFDTD